MRKRNQGPNLLAGNIYRFLALQEQVTMPYLYEECTQLKMLSVGHEVPGCV